MISFFAKQLQSWHALNPRPLPWDDGPRDPYHIWISEIIMQQTRIEQGAPYYLKFISRFPNVQILANASTDEVLRYWQGLGYYSRARNLHKAGQHIESQLGGIFPESYDALLSLPGVGPYSAAAIASFAYGLPYPVVDGNVKRVIARFSGVLTSIDDASTHEAIRMLAKGFMKGVDPGDFNQSIMNFGALVCKPKGPLCISCPLSKKCYAFANGLVDALPIRSKKKTNTLRYFHFIVVHHSRKILMQRREGKDIWTGLYTPLLLERNSDRSPSKNIISSFVEKITGQKNIVQIETTTVLQQQLSHQTIFGRFHHIKLNSSPGKVSESYVWVNHEKFHALGKPKMIVEMKWIKP